MDFDILEIVFGQHLTAYIQPVAFVILVVAALRFSRALPNSTWVRMAALILSVAASAQFIVLPALESGETLSKWTPALVTDLIHQSVVVWALSAIMVEVALDKIAEIITGRLTDLFSQGKALIPGGN